MIEITGQKIITGTNGILLNGNITDSGTHNITIGGDLSTVNISTTSNGSLTINGTGDINTGSGGIKLKGNITESSYTAAITITGALSAGSLATSNNGNLTIHGTGKITTGTNGILLNGNITDSGTHNITVGGVIQATGNIVAGNGSIGTSFLVVPVWDGTPPTTEIPTGAIIYNSATNRYQGFRASDGNWNDLD